MIQHIVTYWAPIKRDRGREIAGKGPWGERRRGKGTEEEKVEQV